MRKDILASVAFAALLAGAPAWAQSSSGTAPSATTQMEKSDAAKSDAMKSDAMKSDDKAAAGSAAGASSTADAKAETKPSDMSKSTDAAKPATSTSTKPAVIAAQEQDQLTADKLIGMDVHNPQNEKIGEIEDLVLGSDMQVEGIVVSVGGFLGLGKHDVALNRDQVQFATKGDRNNERVATVNMTKDQLKAAPEFKTLDRQRAEADADRARTQGAAAGAGARPGAVPPPATAPASTPPAK